MRKLTLMLVVVVAAAAVVPATAVAQSDSECSFPVERTDATGTMVTVSEEPQSVVTLNPSAAQTMWEIGAQEKVVGVTKFASNLAGAESKTNISNNDVTISNEVVVGLEPDLVLAPNTITNETVETLRGAGLTVYRFHEAQSIEDIKDKTRLVGRMAGACDGASETVEWMNSRLSTVDAAVENADRPDVVYSFFGFTAGAGTFIDTILERAGGNNVAANAGITSYQQLNEEILVDRNVDWLVLNSDDDQVPASAGYNSTTAVQEGQVVVVDTNRLNRPAPRVVYAVSQLAEAFHPDAYAAANTTVTPTETPVETQTATATATATADADDDTASPTPGESGPGFGLVAAVVALLATVSLAARRR